jgi:hypothetical protein
LSKLRVSRRLHIELAYDAADWKIVAAFPSARALANMLNQTVTLCVNERQFTSAGTYSVVSRAIEKYCPSAETCDFLNKVLNDIYNFDN